MYPIVFYLFTEYCWCSENGDYTFVLVQVCMCVCLCVFWQIFLLPFQFSKYATQTGIRMTEILEDFRSRVGLYIYTFF